jgi:PQQ-like domain/Putative Ig domain
MTTRLRFLGLALLVLASGCGGGGGGSSSAPPVVPPSGLTYSTPQTYYVGTAVQALTPTVSGSVTNYSVSPPLPAGLSLNSSSGLISGTPTAWSAATVHTVTASNAGGQTTFGMSITVYAGTVDLLSGDVSRTVVGGTPVSAAAQIKPHFAVTGTLYAAVTSSTDSVFQASATATPGTDGAYTLELTTSTNAAAGVHTGTATVTLCQESTCQASAALATLSVPFSVTVMTPASAWPGNHLTTLSPWTAVPDWTTFQGNAAHTGYVPVALNPDRIATRWQRVATAAYAQAGGSYYKNFNAAVSSGGLLFTAEGKELLASNEHDGSVAWRYSFSTLAWPSANPPAVAEGTVYMAAGQSSSSTYFWAFDAATGAQRFKTPMTSQWERYLAPTIGSHGVYTNAGTYGGVYGFDEAGNQLFFRGLGQTSSWTPAVDETGVYCYTNGNLQVLDPSSGTVVHTIVDPTFTNYVYEIGGSPVLGAPGSVFVANYINTRLNGGAFGNTLLNFDVAAESIRWQVAGDYPTTPAYRAGILYAANNKPTRLEARAEDSGALAWSWVPPQAGDTSFESEVMVTDNLVFVCTNLALYAIDLTTHKTVWSYPIVGRLTLSAQGVLYVAEQTTLTAFNVK